MSNAATEKQYRPYLDNAISLCTVNVISFLSESLGSHVQNVVSDVVYIVTSYNLIILYA